MEPNRITEAIIGAAIAVHQALGPGLLESVYGDSYDFSVPSVSLW